MKININHMQNINYKIYNNLLKKYGIVTINELLEDISDIRKRLEEIPKDWWFEKMNIHDNVTYRHSEAVHGKINDIYRNKCLDDVKNIYNKGEFCYHFKESRDTHFSSCLCVICDLKKIFISEDFLNVIRNITNDKNISVKEIFVSLYEKGNFLSVHHDKNKGKYAFVFSLNPNWNPVFGGLLNFYDINTKSIYKTCIPSFNTLTIFSLPKNKNINHFVSEVTADKQRFSVTGWLD